MPNIAPPERILAAATGSTGGLGLIAAIAATTGKLLVCCDNRPGFNGYPTDHMDWRVRTDKACTVQLLRSQTSPTATITFADAKPVDNGDTFVLNGLTFTAKTSGAVAASHEYNLGADNAAAAANLTALLNTANGVPGVTATVAAVSATDVITITPATASVLQFAQGNSDADEIVWVGPALTSLVTDGSAVTISATNAAYAGQLIPTQWIDGWSYGWCLITNSTGDAQTVTVGCTKY